MVTHSEFKPFKCTHTVVNTHLEQLAAILLRRPGVRQFGVGCLAQGSHLSCGIEGGRERWLFTSFKIKMA